MIVPVLALIGAVSIGAVAAAGTQSPRVTAERMMQAVSAVPANSQLTAEPFAKASSVLSRADDARAAGDHEHAALLEAVALEWAETGRDLVRAAAVEAEADDLAREAGEAEERLVRAQALLEQTVARRGRAKARLEELEGQPAAAAEEGQP